MGQIPKDLVTGKNVFLVDCCGCGVKQKFFHFIKNSLKEKSIPFTELKNSADCNGIICNNFKIFDKDFCNIPVEKFNVISLENFKNTDCKIIEKRMAKLLEERNEKLNRSLRFLSACRTIADDVVRLESGYINKAKLNRFTQNQWQKISQGMKGKIGTEYIRSITCLTLDGSELNMEAFDLFCGKVLTVVDNEGGVAEIIVDRLRGYALGSGYDVISCKCALGKTEHIIIPELSFGVFTSKYYHRSDFENERKIYAKRFLNSSVENIKFRREFSQKAYRKMMNEVFASLDEFEKCNRQLDRIYSEIIDKKQLRIFAESFNP